MITTCGIFLINDKGQLLITHPTNSPWDLWSIPKGVKESLESYLDAAIREAKEEIGINLKDFKFKESDYVQLPSIQYLNGKKILYSYFIKVGSELNHVNFSCSSYVHGKDYPSFPEIDMINWVDLITASKLLHPNQAGLLPRIIEYLVR